MVIAILQDHSKILKEVSYMKGFAYATSYLRELAQIFIQQVVYTVCNHTILSSQGKKGHHGRS